MSSAKQKLKSGDSIHLHIDRLSVGGRGVGRHEGLVVFVSDVAPNEDVEAQLTFVKKNFAEARLVKVLSPSTSRVEPPCPVAGVCGGCSWQHVSYDEQIRQKREIVRESLRKFSKFDVSDPELVRPTIASPNEFRYRNRVQLHHAAGLIGFYKRGSHSIVDIDDCPITERALTERFSDLRASTSDKRPGRTELFLTEEGDVAMRGASISEEDDDNRNPSGTAFSQVNTAQNHRLIEYVIESLKKVLTSDSDSTIYDLYSGNGNFTFPIAAAFPRSSVASAELSTRNVALARARAAKEFAHRNMRIEEEDVATFIRGENGLSSSTVVLDPPRVGCAPEVMSALAEGKPRNIIYISCHPVTLGRDLAVLKEAGYRLLEVQPFDMFPQTDHVETVVVLRR